MSNPLLPYIIYKKKHIEQFQGSNIIFLNFLAGLLQEIPCDEQKALTDASVPPCEDGACDKVTAPLVPTTAEAQEHQQASLGREAAKAAESERKTIDSDPNSAKAKPLDVPTPQQKANPNMIASATPTVGPSNKNDRVVVGSMDPRTDPEVRFLVPPSGIDANKEGADSVAVSCDLDTSGHHLEKHHPCQSTKNANED